MAGEVKYKRVLLKLSGEVLAGEQKTGVDVETVGKIATYFIGENPRKL